jgi:hypothetical protein
LIVNALTSPFVDGHGWRLQCGTVHACGRLWGVGFGHVLSSYILIVTVCFDGFADPLMSVLFYSDRTPQKLNLGISL